MERKSELCYCDKVFVRAQDSTYVSNGRPCCTFLCYDKAERELRQKEVKREVYADACV